MAELNSVGAGKLRTVEVRREGETESAIGGRRCGAWSRVGEPKGVLVEKEGRREMKRTKRENSCSSSTSSSTVWSGGRTKGRRTAKYLVFSFFLSCRGNSVGFLLSSPQFSEGRSLGLSCRHERKQINKSTGLEIHSNQTRLNEQEERKSKDCRFFVCFSQLINSCLSNVTSTRRSSSERA